MARKLNTIAIKTDNVTELTEALARVRGASKSEAWASIGAIEAAARAAEARLDVAGVPVKSRAGCGYEYVEAGPAAAKYRFKKTVAAFRLSRRASGWFVESYGQVEVFPKTPALDRVVLTAAAKEAVVVHALKPFRIAA